jgi:type IV pilus assembly protein PilW
MNAVRACQRARGVTLIELMISIVIGLVVVAAVMVTFVNSGKAGRYEAALNQMNQDAQFALNVLSREVQIAGYVSPGNSLATNTSPLFGCDATRSTTAGAIPFVSATVSGQPVCSTTVTAPTVSALEVVYEADIYNTVPTTASAPTDCAGNPAPTSGAISITRNRYFVDRATGGRPELYCASDAAGMTQVPVAENVEEMHIWYGVVASTTPSQIIRYARAADVNAQPAGEWNNVMAARICLLMRSAEPILTGDDAQSYRDCSNTSQTYTDRYLRRAYFTTATVRAKMIP